MFKTLIIVTILITFSPFGTGNPVVCHNDPFSTVVLKHQSDINVLAGCEILNASLLINLEGESSADLSPLSDLKQINGYLAVIHSPILKNLFDLNQIQVEGQDLYQNKYGVAILDNDDLEDSRQGLCWTDQVNWTLISSNPSIVSGNAQNCSDCHSQCSHCWIGQDVQACQTCQNLITGYNFTGRDFSCLQECPNGTLQNPSMEECLSCNFPDTSFCWEYQNPVFEADDFEVLQVDQTSLRLNWKRPSQANGLILKYHLYSNQYHLTTISNKFGSDGFGESYFSYLVTGLEPYTFHNYTILAQNWFGQGESLTIGRWTLPNHPSSISQINQTFLNQTSLVLKWDYPTDYPIESFDFEWDRSITFSELEQPEPGKWEITLIGLEPGTTYQANITVKGPFGVSSLEPYQLQVEVPGILPVWSPGQIKVEVPDLPEGASQLKISFDSFKPSPGPLDQIEVEFKPVGSLNLEKKTYSDHPKMINLTNLVSKTLYQVRLRVSTLWNHQFSNYSDWIEVRTQVGPPEQPFAPQVLDFDYQTDQLTLKIIPSDQETEEVTYFLEYDPDPFEINTSKIMSIQVQAGEEIQLKVNGSLWLATKVYTDPYWTLQSHMTRWIYPNRSMVVGPEDDGHDFLDHWLSWLLIGLLSFTTLVTLVILSLKWRKRNSRTYPEVNLEGQMISAYQNPTYHEEAIEPYDNPIYYDSKGNDRGDPKLYPDSLNSEDWDLVDPEMLSQDGTQYGFPDQHYQHLYPNQIKNLLAVSDDQYGFPDQHLYPNQIKKLLSVPDNQYSSLKRQKEGTYIDVSNRFDQLKAQADQTGMVPKNMVSS